MDKIGEKIVEEEETFGILKFLGWALFLFVIVYGAVTLFNVAKGKNLTEAVPCGGSWIANMLAFCNVLALNRIL